MVVNICLVMIVKNEGAVIGRALQSVEPYIKSYRVIDTGSTDDTVQVVQESLKDVWGYTKETPFVDFGFNRSEVMEWAQEEVPEADWVLMLDADMTVQFARDFEDQLEAFTDDQALLTMLGDVGYRLPLLLRNSVPWKYVGRTHEYVTSDQPYTRGNFDGLTVTHLADGGSRHDKFERDLELLKLDHRDNQADPRPVFYIAQTYRDLGDLRAARDWYEKRAGMGGWDEEVFYAMYQQGVMEDHLGFPSAMSTLEAAYDFRPTRAEPLYQLARINRLRRRHRIAVVWSSEAVCLEKPDDILFVEDDVYAWLAEFEHIDSLWRVGMHTFIPKQIVRMLAKPSLPVEYADHLKMIQASL